MLRARVVRATGVDHALLAVTSTASQSSEKITRRFQAAGFDVDEQEHVSRTRADRAVVLSVTRVSDEPAFTASQTSSGGTSSGNVFTVWLEFQPVWSLDTWSRTGVEILVADDDHTCAQLDAVSYGLGIGRGMITIKPTNGWQGYGWNMTG
jgi:hypothetical protein